MAEPPIGWIGPGWLIALDGASFAVLGIQAWRTPTGATTAEQPVDQQAAESGFRLLARRRDLLSLTVLSWLFFFLYGPVEAAMPVYVAHDLHADAELLGTAIGGPLVGSLGAAGTLLASGVLTVLLAAAARLLWVEENAGGARRPRERLRAPWMTRPRARPGRAEPARHER